MQRNALTLFIKAILCVAATFTLLGASLAFQQPKPARGKSKPAAASAPPQVAPPKESDKLDRPASDPYTGSLSIFEDAKRDEKLQIDRVMDILRIGEGSRVADIGAGSGWFTARASRRVGAQGLVYAVEINRGYLRHIEERAAREGLANIRAVLGKEDDPLLPEAGVDAVLILKTYHEIAEPIRLLRNLRRSLAAGALVGVIDRNGAGDDHGLDDRKVIAEAGRAGFALVAQHDFVKPDGMDYFLVFRARD